jgi:sec-independent protein translocase protein TatC
MEQRYPFTQHLEELRRRLLWSLAFWGAGAILSFPWTPHLLRILKEIAGDRLGKLAYFSPEEALLIYTRIGLCCGFALGLPFFLYQAWRFVAPAVPSRFQRYAGIFMGSCLLAFLAGGAFAWNLLLPSGLDFLLKIGGEDLIPIISAARYVSFVTGILLACGLVFQMPVAAFILGKAGILRPAFLRRNFHYALIVILAASAILTPTTDIFNMFLLALPMVILYEISIWVAKWASLEKGASL